MNKKNKEFLYLGHYQDDNGNYILKIGTTKNLNKRLKEHNIYYKSAKYHPMKENSNFVYDWYIQLSHDNTLKYESEFKKLMQQAGAKYLRNDRFIFQRKPKKVFITIKKTYEITL